MDDQVAWVKDLIARQPVDRDAADGVAGYLQRLCAVAVPALAASRHGRLLLAAAWGRHVADWRAGRPALPLHQWLPARIADDLAYGAGVWWGALRHRTLAPLLPDAQEWPGRDGVRRA
jgi:hypothetical protein